MRRVRRGWAAVGVVAVAAAVALALHPAHESSTAEAQVSQKLSSATVPSHTPIALRRQRARLLQALTASRFPDFDPPLSRLGSEQWLLDQQRTGCATVSEAKVAHCRFGNPTAKRLAVVVGDSVAIAWTPGIRQALEPRGWAVQQLTRLECPAWTLPGYVRLNGSPFYDCASQHALVRRVVREEKPDLVVLATAAEQVQNAKRPDMHTTGADVAASGLTKTIRALRPDTRRLVVLSPPPGAKYLVNCVTRRGTPADCVRGPTADWSTDVAGESAAAAASKVAYVQTHDWFCVDDLCPAFVGRTPVTVDGTHLSIPFSKSLAPLLRPALLGSPAGNRHK